MGTEFIGGEKIVWKSLRKAFGKGRRADVAVAFLASGAKSRLRLAKGSTLVVNASDDVVRSGQTDPREIRKFQRAGVRVYSDNNLHAKVFVVGETAFIGSANVSTTSESRLSEAIVFTDQKTAVRDARRFVRDSAHSEIGPERLKVMLKLYRPPRYAIHGSTRRPARDFLWFVPLIRNRRSHAAKTAEKVGLPKAEAQLQRRQPQDSPRFRIDDFEWTGGQEISRLKVNDEVIQHVRGARRSAVTLPIGHIVHIQRFVEHRQKCAIVFLEIPKAARRVDWSRLKVKLGSHSRVLSRVKNNARKVVDSTLLAKLRQHLRKTP